MESLSPSMLQSLRQIDKSKISDEERSELIVGLKGALAELQTPVERIQEQVLIEPYFLGVIKSLQDLCLFEKWQAEGNTTKSISQLAEMVGADSLLLGRLLRYLVAMNGLEVLGSDQYRMNEYSVYLGDVKAKACLEFALQIVLPSCTTLSSWLAELKWQNPSDSINTAFIRATPIHKDMHLWTWLNQDPKRLQFYDHVVSVWAASAEPWINVYPAEILLPTAAALGSEDDLVTLVDVGAGMGGPSKHFTDKFAGQSGRVILQDQPDVIANLKLAPPADAIAYDFFTPQPIKGARAYFLRNIIHDWPEEKSRQILKSQASAMTRGVSKLLINDHVLSADNPTPRTVSLDMTMMTLGSAIERTEPQWRDLIAGTGLQIIKIWHGPPGVEAVIECMLE